MQPTTKNISLTTKIPDLQEKLALNFKLARRTHKCKGETSRYDLLPNTNLERRLHLQQTQHHS